MAATDALQEAWRLGVIAGWSACLRTRKSIHGRGMGEVIDINHLLPRRRSECDGEKDSNGSSNGAAAGGLRE